MGRSSEAVVPSGGKSGGAVRGACGPQADGRAAVGTRCRAVDKRTIWRAAKDAGLERIVTEVAQTFGLVGLEIEADGKRMKWEAQ